MDFWGLMMASLLTWLWVNLLGPLMVICIVLFPVALVAVSLAVSFRGAPHQSSQLWSSYECGFLAQGQGHRSFSLFFFQLCLLFIIFDAEILILMPLPELREISATAAGSLILFLVMLTWGLYHEWREGALTL